MATLTDYKGLDVVEGATGAGGEALTDDFKALADRAPQLSSSNPTSSNDSSEGYFVGSLWLNSSTQTLWMCTDSTASSAVWKSVWQREGDNLYLVPEDDGSVNIDNLQFGGNTIASTNTNGTVSIAPDGNGILSVSGSANIGNQLGEYLQVGNNQYISGDPSTGLSPAIYLYRSSKIGYGIKLQKTGSEFGTTIFGPNEANRFISFNNISSTSTPTNDTDFGTEHMRIDLDTGFVGIGTASPDSRLHVNTGAAANVGVKIETVSGQTANPLEVKNDSDDSLVKVTADGDLCVGSGSADAKFDVDGEIAIKDGMTAPSATSGKAKLYIDSSDGDLKIVFGDGTVKTIVVDS